MTDRLITPPDGAAERMLPPVSPAAEPYWEATRDRRFLLQWCRDCERPVHFPREACPACLGTDLAFRPASGRGVVHAVTVVPKPGNPSMKGRGPYAVALVQLEEGVRFFTNVIAEDPDSIRIDDPVELAWEPLADGRHLAVFVVSSSGTSPRSVPSSEQPQGTA